MKKLLSIIEQGGYPDFTPMYREAGYEVTQVTSTRKATSWLKKNTPELIVMEFNYDPHFRDRLSNVETIISIVERNPGMRLIVFYDKEAEFQFRRLEDQYELYAALEFPINQKKLKALL